MKLTWRDAVTTALLVLGGAMVYAKFYEFSWALIGSWRSAIMLMAAIGVGMYAFSSFEFTNLSILNVFEILFGFVAIGLAITGAFVTSGFLFYSLAGVLGGLWLVDTARHIRHSLIDETASSFHHHAPVH